MTTGSKVSESEELNENENSYETSSLPPDISSGHTPCYQSNETSNSLEENERLEQARRLYEEDENRQRSIDSQLHEKPLHSASALDHLSREQQQMLQETMSHVPNEDLQLQRNHLNNDGNHLPSMHSMEQQQHMEGLQSHHHHHHYLSDYHHPMLKLPPHLQEQHSRLREQAASHMQDYEDHQSLGTDHRHLVDHLPSSERPPNEAYWNMHLGMLRSDSKMCHLYIKTFL